MYINIYCKECIRCLSKNHSIITFPLLQYIQSHCHVQHLLTVFPLKIVETEAYSFAEFELFGRKWSCKHMPWLISDPLLNIHQKSITFLEITLFPERCGGKRHMSLLMLKYICSSVVPVPQWPPQNERTQWALLLLWLHNFYWTLQL